MGHRTSLDVLEKSKSLASAGNQTPDHPVCALVLWSLSCLCLQECVVKKIEPLLFHKAVSEV
jgi:hypothetical protein